MGSAEISPQFWRGRRVFITGHTGFKGGWLALWLHTLGAEVHGYALKAPTEPSFFELCQLGEQLAGHEIGDIRDAPVLALALERAQPEILFHMAAQPLVRLSYDEPVETISTNVLGTAIVLQEARRIAGLRAIINVTSDKCYENTGANEGYRESDPMGGHDPYSASKGAAELIAASFRRSFYSAPNPDGSGAQLASVRAGNVIGGGDWAADRLVPDFFRARGSQMPLVIRSPNATRPWQHVLEPLSGYLALAQQIGGGTAGLDQGWNFGPDLESVKPVRWITDYLTGKFGGRVELDKGPHPHEAAKLQLDCSKAQAELGWAAHWALANALDKTGEWHDAHEAGADMRVFSISQIATYPGSGLA